MKLRVCGDHSCHDPAQAMALFRRAGRLAPQSHLVWKTWRSFLERGYLTGDEVESLASIRRLEPLDWECVCPYCRQEMTDFPWMGKELELVPSAGPAPELAAGALSYVPRRLIGVLLLLPPLPLWLGLYSLVICTLLGLWPRRVLARGWSFWRGTYAWLFHDDLGAGHLLWALGWIPLGLKLWLVF
ncbi:MAG: hypothetical protein AB7S38_06035 [Vulcanimicrobiota bacterium]